MELLLSSIVIKGQGFTPHLISASILQDILPSQPKQAVTTPPFSMLEYPDGYQVSLQEDRMDIKRQRPPSGVDVVMQEAVLHLLRLWPLVKPTAIGINFEVGDAYQEGRLAQEDLLGRFLPREALERVLGSLLIGSKHSLVFHSGPAKVTIQLTTDALIAERPGYTLDFNAHHQPVADVEPVIKSQEEWYDKITRWSEGLIEESW